MTDGTVTLDVREALRQGQEPFGLIMQTVAGLRPDQNFRLVAPFEPVPLYAVLRKQGFSAESKPIENGYEVLFARLPAGAGAGAPAAPKPAPAPPARPGGPVVLVDARGLEPPEPMVKILEAVSTLPEGASLRAHTERRPMHLYEQLEERGFQGQSEEQSDGSFITHITRR